LEPGGADDRLEVRIARIKREVGDCPVGHAEAALVIANEGRERAQVLEEMAPDRAAPIVLEVAQPARHHDQRRAIPMDRPGEPGAVMSVAEADRLTLTGVGATRTRGGPADHRCSCYAVAAGHLSPMLVTPARTRAQDSM